VTWTDIPQDIMIYNFSNADIDAPYVELDNMTTTDNITWTGTFYPVDNSSMPTNAQGQGLSYSSSVDFTVGTNITDFKGNPGIGATSDDYVVDTKPPYVVSVNLEDATGTELSSFSGRCVPVNSNIDVTFDYDMFATSITSDESAGCGATMQVSSDDFNSNSCVAMGDSGSPPASNSDRTFTLNPSDNLTYGTTYKIRVTTGVQDELGNNMTSQYTDSSEITTSPLLASADSDVFVAVGQNGAILRSTNNGASWDNETCQVFTNLNGVTYGNNTFVAVGTSGRIIRSTNNASSWHNSTSGTGTTLNGVAYGNGNFAAVGNYGRVYTSTDGSSWTQRSSGNSYNLNGVAYGNSTFVGVGRRYNVRSTNATSWSFTNPSYYEWRYHMGVTYSGGSTFLGVGQSGKIIRSTNSGSSWDNMTTGTSPYPSWGYPYLYGVAYGNSTYVAVGASGTILTSTDGATWTSRTSGTSNILRGVAYGNSTFVAVGYSGTILTSTNGTTWTTRTSGTSNHFYGVTFGE